MNRFYRILCCLVIISSFSFAYIHGGNSNHPLPPVPNAGEVYVFMNSGATYVTQSNQVNVDTLRITQITTNTSIVTAGMTMSVTMSVRNTGTISRTIANAEIWMYTREFGSINPTTNTPADYRVSDPNILSGAAQSGAWIIAPGATTVFNFSIIATSNSAAFIAATSANPFVLDGYVSAGNPPLDIDWRQAATLFNGYWQYAADVTANWDTSGPPVVSSVQVSPNPAKATTVIVTVNFSEWMDTSSPPNIDYFVNGAPHAIASVGWASNTAWVGTFIIPSGLSAIYDGVAALRAFAATDNAGNAMAPSMNVGSFIIDTLPPTASLVIAPSANIGMNFPVVFVATDPLMTTPSLQLLVSANTMIMTLNVVFGSNIGATTWNGTVNLDPSVVGALILTARNTVATFNIPAPFTDWAGNTSNVLLGVITVDIVDAVPIISTVNFDSVPAYNGMIISSEPFIVVNVIDFKGVGISPNSVRVSVDGVLRLSGPVTIFQAGNVHTFSFAYPGILTLGNHYFEFGVSDLATPNNVAAIPYGVTVNVFSNEFALTDPPIPFPNPFSPNGDGVRDTTIITYKLTKSGDVSLYIYDMNGDLMWKRLITKGQEGSHAGVNQVPWDGAASFSGGGTLPNGIYICHIIADVDGEKKSLGRTKIFILK